MTGISTDQQVIQKGVVLTKTFLDENADLIKQYLNFWLLYPDIFLDTIKNSSDTNFNLLYYQRIALRACIRYRYHFLTAGRASSKSFIAYLSACLKAIFLAGSKIIIVSDVKGTVVKIALQKFEEIWSHWPLLKNELKTRADDGEQGEKKGGGHFDLAFKNGSHIYVISKDTSRGIRATGAIIEEAALVDEIPFNEVILPQMNVARREIDGYLNPEEPTATQTFITTAGPKTCFMYGKLIELATMAVLRPAEYFIWGFDYKMAVHYGLTDKKFLEEQRYSNTLSSDSFARESMSIWTGASNDAWIDSKMLLRQRKLLYVERKAKAKGPNDNFFYIISVDVGRYRANTAIMVIKVYPKEAYFHKSVVYTEIVHGENFITQQAPRIKELIELYEPREVVIDANGLGSGLMDAMVVPSFDSKTGKQYPPYYSFNNEQHLPQERRIPTESPLPEYNAIIYALKASTGGADSDEAIHANMFSQLSSGHVTMLAHERIVRQKLMLTKKGQKMSEYDKRCYLLPYEMTSRLVDEMCNLKLKPTGIQNRIQIEQISKSTPKDRFSSLEYGLWRVKYYEDEALRRRKRKLDGNFAFFTPRMGRRK